MWQEHWREVRRGEEVHSPPISSVLGLRHSQTLWQFDQVELLCHVWKQFSSSSAWTNRGPAPSTGTHTSHTPNELTTWVSVAQTQTQTRAAEFIRKPDDHRADKYQRHSHSDVINAQAAFSSDVINAQAAFAQWCHQHPGCVPQVHESERLKSDYLRLQSSNMWTR